MYLDTNDHLTVGQGTRLFSADEAAALPFLNRTTGNRASADAIREEYDLIDAMEGSQVRPASFYRAYTTLDLAQNEIDRLVTDHMKGDFDNLLQIFPDFGNYPVSVQIALWDMIYNLGPAGLRREFPKFQAAIRSGDFAEAAEQSNRTDIGEARNEYVYNLLMEAAEEP